MHITANPVADAERWEDRREAEAERTEFLRKRRQELAEATACREIEALTPAQWFEDVLTGAYIKQSLRDSADELLCNAIGETDGDEIRRLYGELMTSPAAAAVRQELARYHAKQLAEFGSGFAPELEE